MPDTFATPAEYAAALRIALDVIDSTPLPFHLREQAVLEAGARLDCPPEERLVRLVQLLTITLARSLARETGEEPEAALRRALLDAEAWVARHPA